MIQIESLVRELLPELCKNHTLSTLCLYTSNPAYLIFIGDSHTPDLVVRFSQSDEICHAHKITNRLHNTLGDLIPKPLVSIERNNQHITIQKGVKGRPWFQLSEKYSSPAQIKKIHTQAIGALNQLHQAISSSPDWNTLIRPGEELRKCYQECTDAGIALPEETKNLVNRLAKSLDEVGELSTFSQHGDFCLNNLIIDDEEIHIIDFEDFGISFMPFHDQFTLALSFHQLSPETSHISLVSAMNSCISQSIAQPALDASHLPGLFLHHLLLRLGSWSQHRLEYRQWLLTILEDFNKSPEGLFQGINLGSTPNDLKRKKNNVIVITTGISGSSVITGFLAKSGLWTGEDTVFKDNTTGRYETYENTKLVKLNESLTKEVGIIFEGKARYDATARNKLNAIYEEIDTTKYTQFIKECNSHSPWIWKDPRLFLTIGFWGNILDLSNTKIIVLHRNSYELWKSQMVKRIIYSYSYLKNSEDKTRKKLLSYLESNNFSFISLEYDRFTEKPDTSIDKLNQFLETNLKRKHWDDIYRSTSKLSNYKRTLLAYLIYIKNYRNRIK